MPFAGLKDTNLFVDNSVNFYDIFDLFALYYFRHISLSISKKALESSKNYVLDNENRFCQITCLCNDLLFPGLKDTNLFSDNSVNFYDFN